MNKTFRLVWSSSRGSWICAPECARSRGKPGGGKRAFRGRFAGSLLLALGAALGAQPTGAQTPPAATSLPSGGQVVAGQAQLLNPAPATLLVQQTSQRAAINWQSFDIGAAAKVQFVQPSRDAVALNRVLGSDASQIFGRLESNGRVYLSNPHGVLFAPGAQVDVGSLVATTMGMGNEDFMAGRDRFGTADGGARPGRVLNQGRLSAATGGSIALLAPEVRNEGLIVAQGGTVALAAGEMVRLDFGPDNRLASIAVSPAKIRTLVENRHAIVAEGGQIIMTARAAEQLRGSVVNTGLLAASSISERGGVIRIEADDIRLDEGSRLDASGALGGGSVLVGGEAKGATSMHQASSVSLAPGALIEASATREGDGGSVVLWSELHQADASTRAQGSIRARGAGSGSGGLVETSGAHVDFSGLRVDTSAPSGRSGNWLIDPYDLTVDAAAASTINSNLASSNVTLQTTASGSSGPGIPNPSGSGDISINAPIAWTSGTTLTLDAYRNVAINAPIAASNNGRVVLITGDIAGNGTSGSSTGDYSFGLGSGGFAGNLSFGSSAGTATLSIATGGSGAASGYTLIYDLGTSASGLQSLNGQTTGFYALAKTISSAGTFTNSLVGSFGHATNHTGTLTGLGNTIDALTLTRNVGASSVTTVGLIGTLNSTVRDIGVSNAVFSKAGTGTIQEFGILVGTMDGGTVKNAFTSGSLTNSNSSIGGLIGSMTLGSVSNAYSTATVAAGALVGGLVGQFSGGTIDSSYATGAVTGGDGTGGLVGRIDAAGSTISNSHASGTVGGTRAGGLVGNILSGTSTSHNVISNAYASGTVTGASASGVGGLVGGVAGYVDVIDAYATGNVSNTQPIAGGLLGFVQANLTVTRSYASGNVESDSTRAGGLIGQITGTGTTTINTSFATGTVSGTAYVGGLVGQLDSGTITVQDAYATGAVNSTGGNAGGLVGSGVGSDFINVYASGKVAGTSPGSAGLIATASNSTVTNGYWDNTSAGTGQTSGYGSVGPTQLTVNGTSYTNAQLPTVPGGLNTAALENGSLPAGFNSGTPNGTPWATLTGFTPYFTWQFPNGAQGIKGHAYTATGTAAASATVALYANGLALGSKTSNSTGAYAALFDTGTFDSSSSLGVTLTLSGGGSVVGATYTNNPPLVSGSLSGFDVYAGAVSTLTSATSFSAFLSGPPGVPANAFGAGVYASQVQPISGPGVLSSSNFTLDQTASGDLLIASGGSFTVTAPQTLSGNLMLRSGNGNITINAPITAGGSNKTLIIDSQADIEVNAPIALGNTNHAILVTGDTGQNGLSANASSDYRFGASLPGGSGNLSFGTTVSSATLKIATGGGDSAPASHTLIYDTGTGTNGLRSLNAGTGKYALANDLSVSGLGTVSNSVNASFGTSTNHTAVFTGLGNVVTGLTLTAASTSATAGNGLFGINYAVLRDIGVSGATINPSTTSPVNIGILAGLGSGGTFKNNWSSGTISTPASGTPNGIGGLVGKLDGSTVTASYSSATVNTVGSRAGGLVGELTNAASITGSHASGSVIGTGGTGLHLGGLVGLMTGPGVSISDSHASTTVSSVNQYTGGLVGLVTAGTSGSPNVISNSYATGAVSSTNTATGGLVGGAASWATINDSHASGSVSSSNAETGGLIGRASGGAVDAIVLNRNYATGSVTATSSSGTQAGGLIGSTQNTTVNTSFATGAVSAYQSVGGLIGNMAGNSKVADAYAQGSSTAAIGSNANVGGLVGLAGTTATLTNVYASGMVTNTGASPTHHGGLIGSATSSTVVNGYWDASSTGTNQSAGYWPGSEPSTLTGGGARTTAQLQDGSLPTGFNSGTANGMPWAATSSFYPYFGWQFPDGVQLITGRAYDSTGAVAASATVSLYLDGSLLVGGTRGTDGVGAYTALVNAGTVTASTPLAGTLIMNGGGSTVAGASYTDTPTLTGPNVTGFDLRQNLLLASTSRTSNSVLQSSLTSTFGAATYSNVTSTLSGARWQFNASGDFTVDSAINLPGGQLGLSAGGNLAINQTLSAGTHLFLQAGGNITESASGGLTATNLVLTGGAVALNSTGADASISAGGVINNNVTTLAASGLSSLSYIDSDALTIGSVGPYLGNVTAATINGTSTSTSGLSAAGSMSIFTGSVNTALTVAGSIATTAGAPDSTLTLRSGGHLLIDNGVSIGVAGGASNRLNTVLWSGWASNTDRGAISVGSATINTNGGLFWAGGQAQNDCVPGCTLGQTTYGSTGVAIGSAHATVLGPSTLIDGAGFSGSMLSTGGGDLVVRGRYDRTGASGVTGTRLHNATLNTGSGQIDIEGLLQNNSPGDALRLSGSTSLVATGAGSITLTGNDSGTAASASNGLKLDSTGSNTISLQTAAGAINLSGSSSSTVAGSMALDLSVAAPASGRILIGSNSGAISLSGSASSANADGISFVANGAAGAGAIQIGAVDATPYSGALEIRGSSIVHGAATTTAGVVALKGSGDLTIASPGSSFAKPLTLDGVYDIGSTHSSLVLGNSSNSANVTLSSALSALGNIQVQGGDLLLNAALSSGSGSIKLAATGSVSDGSAGMLLSPGGLLLQGGAVTLDNSNHQVVTLAAVGLSTLDLLNNGALTVGTVGAINGVTGSGALSIATRSGNLTLSQAVATLDISSNAVTLNAGRDSSAGTAAGGEIIVGGGTIAVGSGGRATLYSGSSSGSTGLATLLGSGSGRFRYNSDETVSNFSTALGNGLQAVLRESRDTAVVVANANQAYGGTDAPSLSSSNLANGDSAALTVLSPQLSGAGRLRVGSYAVTVSNLADLVGLGYTSTGNSDGSINITPKAITVSGISAADKVYDGNSSATVSVAGATLVGLVSGDALTVSASGSFADKHAAVGKTVSLSSSYAGADIANYTISDQASTTASITPKALTVSGITAADKVYDGNSSATVSTSSATLAGLVSGDLLGLVASGSFADKHAAAGKTVSLSSSYGGADAGNYAISDQASTTASITPKALTVSGITAADKVYDGNSSATVSTSSATLAGLVSGDLLGLVASGSFADKQVGSGKTVSLNSSYGGPDAANYAISDQASTTAGITPKALTVSGISAADKVYDGNSSATVSTSGVTLVGLVSGDALTVAASGSFADKHAAAGKTVSLSSSYAGADIANYTISDQASTTASITPKALTVSGITAADKVYDGNSSATVSVAGASLAGLVSGDALTVSASGSFADKHVGSGKAVSLSSSYGGADAGNYAISDQTSTTASIAPKSLTVSGITAADKVYDGNSSAMVSTSSATLAGLVSGDLLGLVASGSFADKQVGSGKTVSLNSSYGGPDAANYTISDQASTTASITPKALTVSGITAADKVYDGNSSATVSVAGASLTGLVSGDALTVAASGSFADKHAAASKTVMLNSSYAGADIANYTISDQASTTASITPKALTVSGITAADKVYDGNSSATVSTSSATLAGLVSGDLLGLVASGNFADKQVGSGKTVSLNSSYGGPDAANYAISDQTSTTASITPKSLTVSGITAADKVYDGNSSATVSVAAATLAGLVSGDALTVAASGSFADKHAAAGKTVSLSSSYTGADITNYTISDQTSTTASITPKSLTVSGITAADKVYDGNSSATVSVAGASLVGLVSGDALTVSASGSFADKHVGSGKAVSLSSSYGGADAGNYAISDQASTTASITPKALTVSGITTADKVYDGNSSATVSTSGATLAGLVSGDLLGLVASGSFADKQVGSGKTVSLNSSYGGPDAANYTISDQTSTTASITPKALTVSGITAADKVYDGNSSATVSVAGATLAGLVSGDALTVSASGSFADKHAAVGKTVSLSSSYAGADIANYTISDQASTTASITPKALTVSGITAADKVYDGNSSATVSVAGASLVGLVSGDALTVSASGSFADKHVGSGKAVSLSSSYGGADAGNYAISDQASTTASITPKALTVSGITTADKVYDGNSSAMVSTSSATLAGLVSGDLLGLVASGSFADKQVGSGKTVSLNSSYGGPDAANYAISDQASTTAGITPKALTVSGISAADKVYDGNSSATVSVAGASLTGLVSGDALTVAASGSFADKHAAAGKTVSLSSSYAGADIANYTISDQASTTASITPKALTVSGITAADKVYDGNSSATVSTSSATLAGLVSGDLLGLVASGSFADKHVGNGKTVSLSSSYGGADAGNYAISDQASTTASITPKALTVSGITAADKVYDGNSSATVSTSSATLAGLVSGDLLGLVASGSFADKQVGSGKTVSLNSSYGGPDAANYAISDQASTTAGITPKALTVSGISAADKVYDGNSSATVSTSGVTLVGLVSGDALTVAASGSFADKHAAAGKTVSLSSSYAGADIANYTISDQASTTASITPKALTVSGITAADKVYDGNSSATVSTSSATLAGLVSGDLLGLVASGSFADKHAAAGKTVSLSSSYGGPDAANYTISDQASTTASITPRSLAVDSAQALDKFFDGNAIAQIVGARLRDADRVAGDQLSLAAATEGSFESPDVGTAKPVSTAMQLGGSDAGNYRLLQPQSLRASIQPSAITGPPPPELPPGANQPAPPTNEPTLALEPSPALPLGGADSTGTGNTGAAAGSGAAAAAAIDVGGTASGGSESGSSSSSGASGQTSPGGSRLPDGRGGTGLPSPDAKPATVSGMILLMSLSTAIAEGGGIVSVLSFEPIVATPGASFTTVLPANTFFHSDPSALMQWSAAQADGTPLPAWLRFDSERHTLTADVPAQLSGSLEILVMARDPNGRQAQSRIQIDFAKRS